ncbi:MAG: phosphatidylserine decarboxylase [Helicobacteraceae bacterium]|jgi:phosphatidylserine decarboxylase|nr:phosphatidylserine decarboxylase [Helicobacteraceae bacterium]
MAKHRTNLISLLFGKFANKKHLKAIQNFINGSYVKMMGLDMGEFNSPKSYATLNELFTRSLLKKREIASGENIAVSPCDSLITDFGKIQENTLFQIKGMGYKLNDLLPNYSEEFLRDFNGGTYINFYLSPRDYHRYHSPLNLTAIKLTHIPGKLYPVNMPYLRKKLNLFCENERVLLECRDQNDKKWFLVFVGALNVGKMAFNFLPDFETNISITKIREFEINKNFKFGEELGYFKMGSTIVLIAEKEAIKNTRIEINQKVKFGDLIAEVLK